MFTRKYHANSLAGGMGFYFDDLEQYEKGMERLKSLGHEEIELQLIEGDAFTIDLFKHIEPSHIELWFETLEDLSNENKIRLAYTLDYHDMNEALEKYEEVCIFEGTPVEYAEELVNDNWDVPEHLVGYIDYAAIANDEECGGNIAEWAHGYIITNANDV